MANKGVKVRSERTFGAVICRRAAGRRLYLLLHNTQGHWDFPKGRPERGENIERTIRREIREESGITKIDFVPGFEMRLRWKFKRANTLVRKKARFRLARTRGCRIRLSREHDKSRWVGAARALKMLKFANSRALLRAADDFLSVRRNI